MSRTVEHIVECHLAAAALRRAGKPVWMQTIKIKEILNADRTNESPEHVATLANRLAAALRRDVRKSFLDMDHGNYCEDLVEAIECMEDCTVTALAEDLKQGCEAVDMLNGWLETVYDWADHNRVWIA